MTIVKQLGLRCEDVRILTRLEVRSRHKFQQKFYFLRLSFFVILGNRRGICIQFFV